MGKLSNLREGISAHVITTIPGTEEKVALVKVNNKTILEARLESFAYLKEHEVDIDAGDLIFNTFILAKVMRDPENLEEQITDFDEINENLTTTEIYDLHYKYLEVQNGLTEDIEEMSEEELEEIKKNLEKITQNDLDGELRRVLRYFQQALILRGLPKDR